jgi:hypothetical protein
MPRNRLMVLSVCLIPCLATAALAEDDATLLTDPVQLTRLGFPADARNVYVAKGVDLDRPVRSSAPKEFGTVDSGWTTVLGTGHHPRNSAVYDTVNGGGDVYLVSGGIFFDAHFPMPQGSLWQGIRWWGVDDAAQFTDVILIVFCSAPDAAGGFAATVVGNATSDGLSGEISFFVPTTQVVTVDNAACVYVARTRLNATAGEALLLRKVRAQWRRQVSPAPGVATFPNDTPTTHPFFRFIEALAASRITAGCAPQSFCPDAPITRGEMAVFFAAALGLHWP